MHSNTNLLPESVANSRYAVARLKAWGAVWLTMSLVTLYVCVVQRQHMKELEVSAARLAAEAAPLKKLQAEQQQMEKKVATIRERESWLMEADSQPTLQLLGIISHAAEKNNGRINVRSLTLTGIQRVIPEAAPPAGGNRKQSKVVQYEQRMQLALTGVAVDDLSVASFVAGLREAGVFESVELKSSVSQLLENHETRQYDVTCVY